MRDFLNGEQEKESITRVRVGCFDPYIILMMESDNLDKQSGEIRVKAILSMFW